MPLLQEVQWDEGQLQAFTGWFHRELENTIGDRAELDRKWADYIVQWRARMPEAVKDFPWTGASNLEFPLTAMHADPVYADFLQTVHTPEDLWHVKPRRPDRVAEANALRQLLTRLDEDFLSMRKVNERAFLDLVVLGTAIYKTHWRHEPKVAATYDEAGNVVESIEVVTMPKVDHVPLQHFYIPANAWDIDPDAPVGAAKWVAQAFWLTENQLNQKVEKQGRLVEPGWDEEKVRFVSHFIADKRAQLSADDDQAVDRTIQDEDKFVPFRDEKIKLYEVWARFDTNGDGVDEDVVLIYHHETSTIVRALHNPFLHGKRPFQAAKYLPGFGFYGIGIAEIDEWAQTTATKLLNGMIDNVTLVNSRMYSAPLGSNVDPNEPIYPSKIWFLEPGEEVGEIRLGDVYPSLPQTIFSLMQWSEMRDGVNELRQGNLTGLPSRTPATSLLESLRQGNKRFDMILSNLRHGGLSEIGMLTLQNFAQYLREDPGRWGSYMRAVLGPVETEMLLKAFTATPPSMLSFAFGVTITATSAINNKEADKQNFLGLIQLLSPIFPQLLQLSQLIESLEPGSLTRQAAERMFVGSVELLQRLLERFDIENASEIIPNAQAIMNALQAQSQGLNANQPPTIAPIQQQQGLSPTGLPSGGLGQILGLS